MTRLAGGALSPRKGGKVDPKHKAASESYRRAEVRTIRETWGECSGAVSAIVASSAMALALSRAAADRHDETGDPADADRATRYAVESRQHALAARELAAREAAARPRANPWAMPSAPAPSRGPLVPMQIEESVHDLDDDEDEGDESEEYDEHEDPAPDRELVMDHNPHDALARPPRPPVVRHPMPPTTPPIPGLAVKPTAPTAPAPLDLVCPVLRSYVVTIGIEMLLEIWRRDPSELAGAIESRCRVLLHDPNARMNDFVLEKARKEGWCGPAGRMPRTSEPEPQTPAQLWLCPALVPYAEFYDFRQLKTERELNPASTVWSIKSTAEAMARRGRIPAEALHDAARQGWKGRSA